MRKSDLVSVVMPAFRMGRFIDEALASVGAQTYDNWEVIVVDDHGPEDGTADFVQSFAKAWPEKRVAFIRHEKNGGVSAARNTAIRASKGEFLAFLDPDDRWLHDHLARSMDLFKADPALDVATGPVLVEAVRQGRTVTWTKPKEEWPRSFFPNTLTLFNFIQPSATLVRAAAVEAMGGFDEDPVIQHIEDYDLWIRLVQGGSRFGFVKEPTSIYHVHGQGATADRARMQRLHAHLAAKHSGFFRHSNALLQMQILDQNESVMKRLDALEYVYSGPMFRLLRSLDRRLRAWKRRIRGGA